MSEQYHSGKGFLKDKLEQYRVDPPPEVWDSILARLGGRSRRDKVLIVIPVAASIALAVTLGINYFGKDIPQDVKLTDGRKHVIYAVPEPNRQAEEALSGGGQRASSEDQGEHEGISQRKKPEQEETTLLRSNAQAAEPILVKVQFSELTEVTDADDTVVEVAREDDPVDMLSREPEEDHSLDILADLEETQDHDHRWVLGAVLSPLYSFRDAEPDALAGTSGQESGVISYAAGFQVGYRATRRLAIESGILFNKMGLSIGASGIQIFSDKLEFAPVGADSRSSSVRAVTNTVGNIVSTSGDIYVNNYLLNASGDNMRVDEVLSSGVNADQGIRQHLDYMELPFNLRYTVLDRSFKIQLVGGMSTNLLVNSYVTMETQDGSAGIGYMTNIRNVNYSGNAGIGFVYHFLDQLSLNLEPRFRYYLNSVNDATLPSTRPFTFGIYTGLNYFF